MATKTNPAVGSVSWIAAEKENALQLLQQEKEELMYPAQHELEWLNEHMAEIFSKSHVDMTNVFKTPGKLRGKTPRTARKRTAPDMRIPLSDVFSSKPIQRSSPVKTTTTHHNAKFIIAADATEDKPPARSQVDSGYHGSSQEDSEAQSKQTTPLPSPYPAKMSPEPHFNQIVNKLDARNCEVHVTEGSFHSAKEEQTTKLNADNVENLQVLEVKADVQPQKSEETISETSPQQRGLRHDFDEIGSPSDESTPDRPLVRKSSLTFASLPAREPLKKSIGARVSRASHLDQHKKSLPNTRKSSLRNGQDLKKEVGFDQQELDDDGDTRMEDSHIEILGHDSDEEQQAVKQFSKSSTQRLHDKINMLGKAPVPRPSKSFTSAATTLAAKPSGPSVTSEINPRQGNAIDEDDDWIKPLDSPQHVSGSPVAKEDIMNESEDENEFDCRAPELIAHEERMKTPVRMSPGPGRMMPGFGHTKSASTVTLASPAKAAMALPASPAKSISVSNPAKATTTPQDSPRRMFDGPLSASKSKLHSIMKTAKGLFSSSASVSAAAKLETLSPNALRLAAKTMPGMYPNLNSLLEDKPLPPSPAKDLRKTRSSTEREKEEKKKEKAMQQMNEQLEKAREKERQKAMQQKQDESQAAQQPTQSSPRRGQEDQDNADMPPPAGHPGSKISRPVKPGREPMPKVKPAPVSIRIGTLSQRMPMNSSSIATSTQETLPAEPKRPGLQKKVSNASLQSTNSTTFKTSVTTQSAKPKALLAAERKKEHDEREVQRKLEQKKELERKRAAAQEEARKQEQKQRAETERKERERIMAEQAKRQAQQQAIERKRQENAKKGEQQRLERAPSEAASNRPASRMAAQPPGRSLINHPLPTNPAKPAKRPLEEETNTRTQAPKFGASLQQNDAKRRRTEDEGKEDSSRPTLSSAPIRHSNLGKKPSIFNNSGYTTAPPSHLNHFPQPATRAQPPQMSQFATAKIPFADAPNPPAATNATTKTPASAYVHRTVQAVKSSPHYPNGDSIHLPEIATDSEDEDSEDETSNAFPIPDWATPGHLTEQLMRQEGMDGDAVFGPIAPLKMEEIFAKGNKDRLKRLRDRTSSANWTMSGDGLTLEEVRIDREQRERMRLEGGWRYGS